MKKHLPHSRQVLDSFLIWWALSDSNTRHTDKRTLHARSDQFDYVYAHSGVGNQPEG